MVIDVKRSNKMPSYCAAIGCNSIGHMPERKFFRFPMLNHSNATSFAITQARQQAWLVALNRAEFFPCHYKNTRVCDLHFISGNVSFSLRFPEV